MKGVFRMTFKQILMVTYLDATLKTVVENKGQWGWGASSYKDFSHILDAAYTQHLITFKQKADYLYQAAIVSKI